MDKRDANSKYITTLNIHLSVYWNLISMADVLKEKCIESLSQFCDMLPTCRELGYMHLSTLFSSSPYIRAPIIPNYLRKVSQTMDLYPSLLIVVAASTALYLDAFRTISDMYVYTTARHLIPS